METSRTGPTGETVDTQHHRALASASRVTILRLVRAAPAGLTAGEVVTRTGQHLTTVRAHLDRLADAGLLVRERDHDGGPGRPSWRYRGAAADPAPGPYRELAAALLDDLSTSDGDPGAAVERAGAGWGRKLAAAADAAAGPADTVVRVLDRLGFAPQLIRRRSGSAEVHLHTCPFLELVTGEADPMCRLHLGVIHGVLDQRGAAPADAALQPFGAPTACVVRLAAGVERRAASR